jgi:hypothetical protein
MRSVIPAVFIKLPAKMKNGTASKGKLSTPLIMRCATTMGGGEPLEMMKIAEDPASAMATGMPKTSMTANDTKSQMMSTAGCS